MNIIKRIRKSYFTRGLAAFLILNILGEIIAPSVAMALTSGPSQPEVQSFEPVETTDMVNLFTGDFTYNIPLMNVPGPNGGYPINLAYHNGISMDQEASWTGLGWNINAGAIDRTVRGLPDDFDGDLIKSTLDIKDDYTIGLGVSTCLEIFGANPCANSGSGALNIGVNFQYNNYKGFGYSLDAGLNIGNSSPSYNVGLSISNEDGIGVNADITLSGNVRKQESELTLGLLFNSKRGVGYTVDAKRKGKIKHTDYKGNKKKYDNLESLTDATHGLMSSETATQQMYSGGSSLFLTESSHAASIPMPMNTNYLKVGVKLGGQVWGAFTGVTIKGFFNSTRLKNKAKEVKNAAYGYENLSGYLNENQMVNGEIVSPVADFSRTHDGNVMKTSSNLATPQITHDIYQIKGQGIGGSFRANRTDIGRIHDPYTNTSVAGGAIVIKLGAGALAEFGGSLGVTYGENKQGAWNNHNLNSNLKYLTEKSLWEMGNSAVLKDKESIYYKSHGETTTTSLIEMAYIGGEEPVTGEIYGNGFVGNYKMSEISSISNERNEAERVGRNNLIHKLTNDEINDFHSFGNDLQRSYGGLDDADNYIHEYEIFYYDWGDSYDWTTSYSPYSGDPTSYLSRKKHPKHNAGYKVLDQSGSSYVYGLPTYNNKTIEEVFSVQGANNYDNCNPSIPIPLDNGEVDYKIPNTYKYHSKRETPGYATSYLLTSILGADYIDIDNNGPSDGDKGYWVRMDYVKYASNYKWRSPFKDAMYIKGSVSTLEDDKAMYTYGEKEVWYMNRLETKTHIAIFELSERRDNFEVKEQYNTGNGSACLDNKSGLKVEKIHLYEKKEYEAKGALAIPIQTVHFVYDYSLCEGIPNFRNISQSAEHVVGTHTGKLTLKELYITYEGNERGKLTPYKFNYDDPSILLDDLENPDYELNSYDRWGGYKDESSECLKSDMPYTKQFNDDIEQTETEKLSFENKSIATAGAWTLKEISLPSGGIIKVEYESDDYAYVQSERATQMFKIKKINDNTSGDNELYKSDGNSFDSSPTERRIYFSLEDQIIDGRTNTEYAQEIYDLYVKDIIKDEGGERNLYFKNYTKLKGSAWDYVSGYVPLERSLSIDGIFNYGVSDLDLQSGYYNQGFITIKCAKRKNGNCFKKYHPMAIGAWQYVRTNNSELLGSLGSSFDSGNVLSKKDKAKKVTNLLGFIPEISQMFQGYRKWCYKKKMAQKIDLTRSVIKLTTPNKFKKGGGSRVKKITLSDNWNAFQPNELSEKYGVQYTYETIENNKMISSGVAQYEPMVGGDENALKYPKYFPGKIPFKTNNNLFYEHPINESYMPAPVVGYSKVLVSSLNTAEQIEKSKTLTANIGRGVSGVKEYIFYTAKDYPVLVKQTDISKKSFNVPIVIPFIGSYSRNKLAATQGYKIELNDMHGKLKSITNFGLDPLTYKINNKALSSVTMNYQDDVIVYNGNVAKKLNNEVQTLNSEGIEKTRLVGVEHEFLTDQRETKNWSISTSLILNGDVLPIPPVTLTIPTVWGIYRK